MSPEIGILGLGSASTTYFIKLLNEVYNQQKDGYSTCPFVLLNTDFNDINPYLPDQQQIVKKVLLAYLNKLASLEVSHIVLPNITLYQQIDLLIAEGDLDVAFIHPINETIKAVIASGVEKVTLFGSAYTMQTGYVSQSFVEAGMEVGFPSHEDKSFLDDLRIDVYQGLASSQDLTRYQDLLRQYDRPVIACSELSIPLSLMNLSDGIYDMIHLMTKRVVDVLL